MRRSFQDDRALSVESRFYFKAWNSVEPHTDYCARHTRPPKTEQARAPINNPPAHMLTPCTDSGAFVNPHPSTSNSEVRCCFPHRRLVPRLSYVTVDPLTFICGLLAMSKLCTDTDRCFVQTVPIGRLNHVSVVLYQGTHNCLRYLPWLLRLRRLAHFFFSLEFRCLRHGDIG